MINSCRHVTRNFPVRYILCQTKTKLSSLLSDVNIEMISPRWCNFEIYQDIDASITRGICKIDVKRHIMLKSSVLQLSQKLHVIHWQMRSFRNWIWKAKWSKQIWVSTLFMKSYLEIIDFGGYGSFFSDVWLRNCELRDHEVVNLINGAVSSKARSWIEFTALMVVRIARGSSLRNRRIIFETSYQRSWPRSPGNPKFPSPPRPHVDL